jgi:hypothetical protein
MPSMWVPMPYFCGIHDECEATTLPAFVTLNKGIRPLILTTDILAFIRFFDHVADSDHRRVAVNANLHVSEHPGRNHAIPGLYLLYVLGLGNNLAPGGYPRIVICHNPVMECDVALNPGVSPLILQVYQLLFRAFGLCVVSPLFRKRQKQSGAFGRIARLTQPLVFLWMHSFGPLGERLERILEYLPAIWGEFEFYPSYIATPEFISRGEGNIYSQESPTLVFLSEFGNDGVAFDFQVFNRKPGIIDNISFHQVPNLGFSG